MSELQRLDNPADLLANLGSAELEALEARLQREVHRHDPEAWVRDRLREHLWSKQAEIARAVATRRKVVVHSAHDVGKTMLASRLGCWFIDVHEPGTAFVVTTAPTMSQVEAVLWREIRAAHAKGQLQGVLNQTEWKIDGALVAFGRKPADYDPSAFQGIHARYVLVIMDEACGIPEALWNAAETLITNEDSRILAIGNPDDPTSHFARICAPGSGWHEIHIDGLASPNFTDEAIPDDVRPFLLSPTWVEERRRSWGEDSPLYVSKVRGKFAEDSDDALIPWSWIRSAQDRFEEDSTRAGKVTLGVDVARYGKDETVIVARRGDVASIVGRYRKQDTMETVGRIVRAIKDLGAAEAVVDSIGVGAGVVDRLAEQGLPVTGLNAGSSARDSERYANGRAELFWGLRDRFERGEIAIGPDDELAAQLAGIHYRFDSKGRILIESKEDARARGVSSPDIADALMLAFAREPEPDVTILGAVNDALWRPSYWRDEYS